MSERQSNFGAQLIVAALFATIGLATLYWFVTFAQLPERQPHPTYRQDYSEKPLEDILTRSNLEERVAGIAAASAAPGERQVGRLSGSPGFYRTEQLITKAFTAAGLTLKTQELEVVVPVTEVCEILDAQGKPLDGVQLYPFEPSGLCTVSPPNGEISAKLVQTESAELKYFAGNQPSNCVILTSLDSASGWMEMAGAGVKAVIVREDEAAKSLRADPDRPGAWKSLITSHETTYPRFLARGPIEQFANSEIKIRCKVIWQTKKVRNIIGILSSDKPKQEALILTAFYDSNSIVPDLAPGAEQSLSLAALLEYARALAPYRGQLERDVIFVAMAGHAQNLAGACKMMEAIETFSHKRSDYRSFEARRADQEQKLDWAKRAEEITGYDDSFLLEPGRPRPGGHRPEGRPAPTFNLPANDDPDFQKWFTETFKIPAGEIHLDKKEAALQRRLAYMRAGSPVYRDGFDSRNATDEERKLPANTHPLLKAYLDARNIETRAGNFVTLPLSELSKKEEFAAWDYASRAHKFYEQAAQYHEQQIKELNDLIAVRDLFDAYKRTLTINLELYSGGCRKLKDLSVLVGMQNAGTEVEPQMTALCNMLIEKTPVQNGEPFFNTIWWGARDAKGSDERPTRNSPEFAELESAAWFKCGRMAFTACNYEFYPPRACTPEDRFDGLSLDVVNDHVNALGKTILAVGFGQVGFKTLTHEARTAICSLNGTVYGSAGSSTMLPNHPMGRNTFVNAMRDTDTGLLVDPESYRNKLTDYTMRGIRPFPILQTNPYGEYEKGINFEFYTWSKVTVDAMRLDDNGQPLFISDAAPASQSVFHNVKCPGTSLAATGSAAAKPINVGMFRCSPVALFDQINPTTMKPFQKIVYMSKAGLSEPGHYHFGNYTAFMEPDFVFYIGLKDGAASNEEILDYRAFLLNVDYEQPAFQLPNGINVAASAKTRNRAASGAATDEPEIYGNGYLAADTPNIAMPCFDAAASMIRTGEKRLELQNKYGMTDEQMLDFHKRAMDWLDIAKTKLASCDPATAVNAAGTSLAYAMNNHPVIRARIGQAVIGILWYLGILVPFVFFFEKLIFCFTDIRKQLLANGLIFLAVFGILRAFHPAFQMVRSSLMILLGFVILLLTLLVTLMVGGKFRQNIKDLRRREGQVGGTDINRGGMVGTAFMLGLNNMRRRKVRTSLTCAALILLTFVMICFTSVTNDLVSVEYAIGHSAWNGILIRDQNYRNLDDSQISNIRQIYGGRFPIATTKWLTSPQSARNTELVIDRDLEVEGIKVSKRATVNAAIQMEWNGAYLSSRRQSFAATSNGNGLVFEPFGLARCLLTQIKLLETARREKSVNYAILPEPVARDLSISIDDVNNGHPAVRIRGMEYEVLGIMDPQELMKSLGPDGKSILPYDLNSVQAMGTKGSKVLIPEDVGRLTGSQVVILNQMPPLKPAEEQIVTVFCSILFPKTTYRLRPDDPERTAIEYKEQRQLVLDHLERTGEPAFYAIDGMACYGCRQRARTITGLLQLLAPLLIAALTVFNTMRSSVYERKEEIYVYNAVGIAPNHVFFMFMAEACVYAVVGAMCGYILSQGTGRILTALNLTGGMNMDYSSIETIYASLGIVAAVLLSTIIPARDAMRLASPSGVASWTTPVAQGDIMEFNLPFTFTPHDRVAVVAYFNRWLDSNGEGSSGPFFCSPPEMGLMEKEHKRDPDLVGRTVPGETTQVKDHIQSHSDFHNLLGASMDVSCSDSAGTPRLTFEDYKTDQQIPSLVSTIWLKPYDLGLSQRLEISLPPDPETGEYIARIKLTLLSGSMVSWKRRVKQFIGSLRKQFLNWRATTQQDRDEMFAEAEGILGSRIQESEVRIQNEAAKPRITEF